MCIICQSTSCTPSVDKRPILCNDTIMIKQTEMTELQPTDFEIAEMQAEYDAEMDLIRADLEAEEWADFILSTIA